MTNNGTATVKRSPIIFIRNFIAIEMVGLAFYLFAAAFGNYKYEVYKDLLLENILLYQNAKVLFITASELVMTIYAFLHWYSDIYIIKPGMIVHEWGIFFKKRRAVPLQKILSLTLASGPLGKLFHYGSIHIQNSERTNLFTLRDISRPQKYFKKIEQNVNNGAAEKNSPPDFIDLLKREESEEIEFKSSLRFDHKLKQVNRDLEKAAMKTVAAFLNSKGGFLVVGADDAGELLGLEYDYQTLVRKDSDGFENHFTQVFNKTIGPESRHLVKLWFQKIDDIEICAIDISSSPNPVYLKMDDGEHFYIRTGNASTPLKLSEIDSFLRSRWQQRM